MPIDLQSEEILPLTEVAKALPRLRGGRKVHLSTIYRWISRGVNGVRLESLKLGRATVTSREALQRFAERQTRADRPEDHRVPARSAAAARELERRGL